MERLRRSLSIALLLLLIVATIITVKSVSAQFTTNALLPPEFTVKYADHSYYMPAITTSNTDPYTGKTTTFTQPGYHVKNVTLDITIKNQAFNYTLESGDNSAELTYGIEIKGHYMDQWWNDKIQQTGTVQTGSPEGYTVVSVPINYQDDSLIDIRIRAAIDVNYYNPRFIQPVMESRSYVGPYSNIQTMSIPSGEITSYTASPTPVITISPTPTENPTAQPLSSSNDTATNPAHAADTIPLTTFAAVVIALVAIIAILTGVLLLKKRKQ